MATRQTRTNGRGNVVVMATAHEALGIISKGGLERPDVVVADIGLPNEDGYVLIRQIRALPGTLGRMPVLAASPPVPIERSNV